MVVDGVGPSQPLKTTREPANHVADGPGATARRSDLRTDRDAAVHRRSRPLALFCKLRRRRLVFSTASTHDLELRPRLASWSTQIAYRVGRRLADAVVVQTQEQVDLAARNLGRSARLIRSIGTLADEGAGRR